VQIPESVLDLTALIVETGGSSGSRAEQMFTAPEREETRRFLAGCGPATAQAEPRRA